MTSAQQALASAAEQAERLRRLLRKLTTKQVRSDDEIQVAKALAYAWFNNHRPPILVAIGEGCLGDLDEQYRSLIAASERATLRSKYLATVKQAKTLLSRIQVEEALALAATHAPSMPPTTNALISAHSLPKRRCRRY